MSIVARRSVIFGSSLGLMLSGTAARTVAAAAKSVGQKWIDGWNSADPEVLVAAFTPDGVYEDVTFGLKKKGSAELRELHKFFHDSAGGLYVKLISSHVANGYGTIEWIFRRQGCWCLQDRQAVRGAWCQRHRGAGRSNLPQPRLLRCGDDYEAGGTVACLVIATADRPWHTSRPLLAYYRPARGAPAGSRINAQDGLSRAKPISSAFDGDGGFRLRSTHPTRDRKEPQQV